MPKLAIALALVLVVASIQCAALCAAPANPPCPHHHKTIDSCSHELVYVQTAAIEPAPRIEIRLDLISFESAPIEASAVHAAAPSYPPLRL